MNEISFIEWHKQIYVNFYKPICCKNAVETEDAIVMIFKHIKNKYYTNKILRCSFNLINYDIIHNIM